MKIRFRFNSSDSIENLSLRAFNFFSLEKRKVSFIVVMIKNKIRLSVELLSAKEVSATIVIARESKETEIFM